MKITITKKMQCHNTPAQCSDIIVNKLQQKFNCKLIAEKKTDTVHGYVTIDHTPNNHIIDIYFYDTDESANFKHLTTLKKLGSIPTENEIKKII
tara:strand:+ start:335 stop:616 length:282 start_codon:yes stop_codon:yes gene_type:complete